MRTIAMTTAITIAKTIFVTSTITITISIAPRLVLLWKLHFHRHHSPRHCSGFLRGSAERLLLLNGYWRLEKGAPPMLWVSPVWTRAGDWAREMSRIGGSLVVDIHLLLHIPNVLGEKAVEHRNKHFAQLSILAFHGGLSKRFFGPSYFCKAHSLGSPQEMPRYVYIFVKINSHFKRPTWHSVYYIHMPTSSVFEHLGRNRQ